MVWRSDDLCRIVLYRICILIENRFSRMNGSDILILFVVFDAFLNDCAVCVVPCLPIKTAV